MDTNVPLRGLSTISFHAADLAAAQKWCTEFLGIERHTSITPATSSFVWAITSKNWVLSTANMPQLEQPTNPPELSFTGTLTI
jgi:hypothetical protein